MSQIDLDYHVISTGSRGNAVRIGPIMIDCGIPFGKMKEDLYKCHTLLITHDHQDHITHKTYSKILEMFPRIHTVANATVAYQYPVNTVVGTKIVTVNSIDITPYEGLHDTEVTYFTFNLNGSNIIYATDTAIVGNPNKIKFDYLFLESNYDEKKLEVIGHTLKKGKYDPFFSNQRHLSTQKCKAFYYLNRASPESVLIELHQSSRFY